MSYSPPDFWSFKPFFTIQPVLETREKQLLLWKTIIINYCQYSKINHINPTNFPMFKNSLLNRELSNEGIQIVINKLIQSGNAEWEDSTKAWLRIIFKSPEVLAGEIYSWYAFYTILYL